jgi:hypothetical protein
MKDDGLFISGDGSPMNERWIVSNCDKGLIMSRLLAALLLVVSCMGFVGCGGSGDQGPPVGPTPESVPTDDGTGAVDGEVQN